MSALDTEYQVKSQKTQKLNKSLALGRQSRKQISASDVSNTYFIRGINVGAN